MSDFTSYIRVAIQGLSDNSPMARAAAYEKARKVIRRQLEARAAGPAEVEQTLESLENAILDIEAEQFLIANRPVQSPAPEPAAPVVEPVPHFAEPESNVTPIGRKPVESTIRPKPADTPEKRPDAPVAPAAVAPPPPAMHGGSFGTAGQALKAENANSDPLDDFQSALTAELGIQAAPEPASEPEPEPAPAPVVEPEPAPQPEKASAPHAIPAQPTPPPQPPAPAFKSAPAPEPVVASAPPAPPQPPAPPRPVAAPAARAVSEPIDESIPMPLDVNEILAQSIKGEDMSDAVTREAAYRRARTSLGRQLRSMTPPPDYETVHSCIERMNEAIRHMEADMAAAPPVSAAIVPDLPEISLETDELLSELEGEVPLMHQSRPKPDGDAYPQFRNAINAHAANGDAIAAEVEDALQDLLAPDRSTPPPPPPPRREAAKPAKARRREAEASARQGARSEQAGHDRWGDESVLEQELLDFEPEFEPANDSRPPEEMTFAPEPRPVRRGGGGRLFLLLVILLVIGAVAAAIALPDQSAGLYSGARKMASRYLPVVEALLTPASTGGGEAADANGAGAAKADAASSEPAKPAMAMSEPATNQPRMEPELQGSATEPQAPAAAEPAVPRINGERAFLFETSKAQAPASSGNVAWSTIESAPAPDAPPEPAIRAEVSIPSQGLHAIVTVRRNLDKTLPATHLVEMIFDFADGYDGGGIASVYGVNFARVQQGVSQPLVGSVVKITENVFLFALSDVPEVAARQRQMFSDPEMIDIPFAYNSGRRVNLRLVVGDSGAKVFRKAAQVWNGTASAAQSAAAPAPQTLQTLQTPQTQQSGGNDDRIELVLPAGQETPSARSQSSSDAPATAQVQQPPAAPAETTNGRTADGKLILPDKIPVPADRPLFDG